MKIHILGIGGTFMSGIAVLAQQSGHQVSGSDNELYPPMSTQLQQQGIPLLTGYDPAQLDSDIDCFIIGNVIKRGNPMMEHILANRLPFQSGPEWLAKNILNDRWVLAVSGTHGKTTATSLLTWILSSAGKVPGFLVGGVPENFGVSADLGESAYFVIEADEYDSAFFDKRSKFIHYHPRTLILNNLEYDHADIFKDLSAIQLQFHYLIRTVPNNGLIISHHGDQALQEVLEMGCWTPTESFGLHAGTFQAKLLKPDGSAFIVLKHGKEEARVSWNLVGRHNVENALAAIAAAEHAGLSVQHASEALATFKNVKRRLELKGEVNNILVYDDFAHHPTAIETTLAGLRARIGEQARLIAIVEFGSFTMRSGVHKDRIKQALAGADMIVCHNPSQDWGLKEILAQCQQPTALFNTVDELVTSLTPNLQAGDHVLVMSNTGFQGIHEKLLQAIRAIA